MRYIVKGIHEFSDSYAEFMKSQEVAGEPVLAHFTKMLDSDAKIYKLLRLHEAHPVETIITTVVFESSGDIFVLTFWYENTEKRHIREVKFATATPLSIAATEDGNYGHINGDIMKLVEFTDADTAKLLEQDVAEFINALLLTFVEFQK